MTSQKNRSFGRIRLFIDLYVAEAGNSNCSKQNFWLSALKLLLPVSSSVLLAMKRSKLIANIVKLCGWETDNGPTLCRTHKTLLPSMKCELLVAAIIIVMWELCTCTFRRMFAGMLPKIVAM